MNKKTKKLNEITDGDPIKILEFLEKNKNIRLKYESSYEDLLFQLKDDKVQVSDGPFEYEHGLLKLKEGFIDLTQQNINYESAFDIFMKWEKPELETWAGGDFNPRKPVYWGDCFIYSSGYIDVEGLIKMLREFITEEDETDEDFRDEGFHWFLDSLGLTSDPEEFHEAFEDNEIDVTDINYTVGTELGLDDISFYSTSKVIHSDYEFIIEYDELNWVFEPKDNNTDFDENVEEANLEIHLMYEGTLFTYINDNEEEMTFEAFRLIVECPDEDDYEWEVKDTLGELVFTSKGDSNEIYLITDLPEDIVGYQFTNSVGDLHDEALNSIEKAVEIITNLKTISFKEINPKDGESIRYID